MKNVTPIANAQLIKELIEVATPKQVADFFLTRITTDIEFKKFDDKAWWIDSQIEWERITRND